MGCNFQILAPQLAFFRCDRDQVDWDCLVFNLFSIDADTIVSIPSIVSRGCAQVTRNPSICQFRLFPMHYLSHRDSRQLRLYAKFTVKLMLKSRHFCCNIYNPFCPATKF
uniref:Uncharacterized protein LOC105133716 isoform X2 n=1 Tax=Rhizophora mucronata TaxID=61149 RepID=A0A2P2MLW9_RHIMU